MSLKKNLKAATSRAHEFVNDHKVAILVTSNVATASLWLLRDLQLRFANDFIIEKGLAEERIEWLHNLSVKTD